MGALRLIPVILCLLVLAAHFSRHGYTILVAVVFALLGLLAVRRSWAARVVQFALVLGALEWVRTLLQFARQRAELGLPSTRLVLILTTVAAVTAASALLFRGSAANAWYRIGPPKS